MTAVKAFHEEGKTIECVLPDGLPSTFKRTGCYLALEDLNGLSISSKEIIESKWYILED